MNICIVVNEYPPDRIAGTAVATRALAQYLVSANHRVHVIVTERSSSSAPCSEDHGVTVVRLKHGRIQGWRWLWRVIRIRHMVKRIHPDVLHGQAISCALYANLAALGRGIPVLANVQGRDLYESSLFQRLTEVRWTLRSADVVVTVSRAIAALCRVVAGMDHIEVVPNGFQPVEITGTRDALRPQFGLAASDFVILCIARLLPVKGLDVLLQALVALPGATLWICGAGPERARLERLASSLGVIERVQFLGFLEDRVVAERRRAADLFVLPSRSEPFGIVLLEAMDAGLPIVATNVGGIPDIVSLENGLLVSPDDPEALAVAIKELMADPGRRSRMGQSNQTKAKNFRWDIIGESYVKLYQQLCPR